MEGGRIEKKRTPVTILTVRGARIEGLAYVPAEIRLLDEITTTIRSYLVVGEPTITFSDSQDTETPEFVFVPKDQIHLAWPTEDQQAGQE